MAFLGQFIDHDITLDVQSKFEKPEINVALDNSRTPNLDLDCVYGVGPEASPHLYVGASLLEGEDISLADERIHQTYHEMQSVVLSSVIHAMMKISSSARYRVHS